jgi:hypothetical protein
VGGFLEFLPYLVSGRGVNGVDSRSKV